MVVGIITSSVGELIAAAPGYQEAFQRLAWKLQDQLDFVDIPEFPQLIGEIRVATYIRTLAQTFSGLLGNLGLITVFLFFLFLEQRYLPAKLAALLPDPARRERIYELFDLIDRDVRTYIGIKTTASLATALASYAVMQFVGLDFAGFWALLIFLLNFIPNIGSIIATALPALLALVQYEGLTPFVIIAVGIGAIQMIIGQIIEPIFAGRSLNVTPLAIIFSLVIWGMLWGIVGASCACLSW